MKGPTATLKDAIRAANQEREMQASQHPGMPESSNASMPASRSNEWVNLTVRVRKRDRVHWLTQAIQEGTCLREAIEVALNRQFGAAKVE
jgi:hypothetical protein